MRSIVLLLLGLACAASGQQATHGRPIPVPTSIPAATPLVGGVFTPDMRVLLFARSDPSVHQNGGWFATALRHERLAKDPSGVPDFSDPEVWSSPVRFGFDAFPPNQGLAPVTTDGFIVHGWLTAAPDPEYSHLPVPYSSDAEGNHAPPGTLIADGESNAITPPIDDGAAGGGAPANRVLYETYRLVVVAPAWWPLDPASTFSLTQPVFAASPTAPYDLAHPMARRKLTVIVRRPRSSQASIEAARLEPGIATFMSWRETVGLQTIEHPIMGVEPSITLDGRLLVFQGHPQSVTGYTQSPFTLGDHVMYSWNAVPFAASGWSRPRQLSEMHSFDAATIVAGRRFDERYPIAAHPLRDGSAQPVVGDYHGAYPWISLEGTDLLHSTIIANDGGRRAGHSLVGASTHWTVRHLDGPINPDRVTTSRFVFTGTHVAPGIWSPAHGLRYAPLPYGRDAHTMPLFGMRPDVYCEAPLEEALDGDYIGAYAMNEAVRHLPTSIGWEYATSETDDLSGRGGRGLLDPGASYPQDLAGMADQNFGAVGQSIAFFDAGRVRIPCSTEQAAAKPALTVEAFLYVPSPPTPSPRFRVVVRHDNSFVLAIDDLGRVLAGVFVGGQLGLSPWTALLGHDRWTHVAFTYESSNQNLALFVDGVEVSRVTLFAGQTTPVDGSTSDIILGPDALTVPTFGAFGDVIAIDEVRISRVARTADEIARHAHAVPVAASFTASPTLPLGLDPLATLIPSALPFTAAVVDLGEILFQDQGLSGSGNISCATCHIPSFDFTDGLTVALGQGGVALGRNTPSIINRIFSTSQFWDGRSQSLEHQAIVPILNPLELGSSSAAVLAYLSSPPAGAPSYPSLFMSAYGQAPSETTLRHALASYQRSIVSGASEWDRHEAGIQPLEGPALAGRELFFGKARCFACHVGSNLTDESFHVTLLNDTDAGRGAVTGRVFDAHRFKTPSLRNVANTAPYFHDGSASSLTAVVAQYSAGSSRTDVIDADIRPLGLTSSEQADLVAFLHSLSAPWIMLRP